MKCQEITHLLDHGRPSELPADQRQRIEAHLAGCPDCAGDWALHKRIAAASIPAMPASLAHWRPAVPSVGLGAAPGRRSRMFLVSGVLIVAVAAAVLSSGYFGTSDTGGDPVPGAETPADAANATAAGDADDSREAVVAEPAAPFGPAIVDERRLLFLPAVYQSDAPAVREAVEFVQAGLVRYFQTRRGIDPVIVSEADFAAAYAQVGDLSHIREPARPGARIMAAGRRLGSYRVIRLTGRDIGNGAGFNVQVDYRYETADLMFGGATGASGLGAPDPAVNDFAAVTADRIAQIGERIYVHLFPEAGLPQREATMADTRLSDAERIRALELFLVDGLRPMLANRDGSVEFSTPSPTGIDIAIELGRTAADPATRERVWDLLAQSRDTFVGQALADAVLYDGEASVRAAAADALLGFRADPVVRAVLESAARDDASTAVRLQARWTLLTGEERPAFVNASLLDTSLSPEQRMAPLIVARAPRPTSFYEAPAIEADVPVPGGPALNAIVGIVDASDDPATRVAGLLELGSAAHPSFLAALQRETDVETRRRVVSRLFRFRDDPAVMSLIKQIRAIETDEDIRRSIDLRLSPPPPPPPPGSEPANGFSTPPQ